MLVSCFLMDVVANSSEETVFLYFVCTHKITSSRSEEVHRKYKAMMNKFKDSRKYDVDSIILVEF